jgi:hypothetical protein
MQNKKLVESMPGSSFELETMLPKSASEASSRSLWWTPKPSIIFATTVGFLLGVAVTRYIDRPSSIGPPCHQLPEPEEFCPTKSSLPLAHRQEVAEAHDIPLEYFDSGYTGVINASDPRNFGPEAWRTLHRFSVGYPSDPTPSTQQRCKDFLTGLPYMIPCPHCGYHLLEFIVFNDKWSGQNMTKCRGVCTTVEQICGTKMDLVDFFVRAHNNVNANNYPCRRMWNASDVLQAYSSPSFTTQGPIDGKCMLIRNTSDKVGLSPNWFRKGDHNDVFRDRDLCEPGVPKEQERETFF